MSKENKTVEMNVETNEVAVVEGKKPNKVLGFVKNNWKKGLAIVAAFGLGVLAKGLSDKLSNHDEDYVEGDYTEIPDEDMSFDEDFPVE